MKTENEMKSACHGNAAGAQDIINQEQNGLLNQIRRHVRRIWFFHSESGEKTVHAVRIPPGKPNSSRAKARPAAGESMIPFGALSELFAMQKVSNAFEIFRNPQSSSNSTKSSDFGDSIYAV